DYVLAARYDQMERCYGMTMGEFLERGFSWFVKVAHIEHKRPLFMGGVVYVRTCVSEIRRREVRVDFEILKKETKKISALGYFEYTMVDKNTGRAHEIPEDVVKMYSI
ncbi:MAG: thioesterase family protein, partial [Verrucomicrobiota bacterium]